MKNKFSATLVLPFLLLASCSSDALPRKGYDKFKELISVTLVSAGFTGDELKYTSCNYVWIQGSGKLDVESLKDAVYYRVESYLSYGGQRKNYLDYFVYYGSQDRLQIPDGNDGLTLYTYAYALVKDGSLKGRIDSLK